MYRPIIEGEVTALPTQGHALYPAFNVMRSGDTAILKNKWSGDEEQFTVLRQGEQRGAVPVLLEAEGVDFIPNLRESEIVGFIRNERVEFVGIRISGVSYKWVPASDEARVEAFFAEAKWSEKTRAEIA